MIMACLPQRRVAARCYTYAGPDGLPADARIGAEVARACGMSHQVLRVQSDFLTDFADLVDETAFATDGCAGPLHAHEIYLSRLAAGVSRVRVTGNFGSELLRSVSTLKPNWLSSDILSPDFRRRVERVGSASSEHAVTNAAFKEIPWHLYGTMAAARTELQVRTPYLDNELVRLAYQAPRRARASSSPACRVIALHNPKLARIRTDQGLRPSGGDLLSALFRLRARISFKLDYWQKEGLPSKLAPLGTLARLA